MDLSALLSAFPPAYLGVGFHVVVREASLGPLLFAASCFVGRCKETTALADKGERQARS